MALDYSVELPVLRSEISHAFTSSLFISQALKYAYADKGAKPVLTGWKPVQSSADLTLTDSIPQSDCKELVDGFIEGAINRPTIALQQVLGDNDSNSFNPHAQPANSSRKTGLVLGKLVPFVGLVGITKGASAALLGECLTPPMFRVMGEQATAGFVMGALLTPSELNQGKGLFSSRMSQGGLCAATFATMTGTAASLNRELPKPEEDSALSKIARGISLTFLTGAVGEMVDTEGLTSFGASIDASIPATACTGVLDAANKAMCRLLDSQRTNNANRLPIIAALQESDNGSNHLRNRIKDGH